MKIASKLLGRPRTNEGTVDCRQFLRAGIVTCAYDEARQSNEKHSVAVAQAVESVKQRHPDVRISETGVRRLLASWRPRNSVLVLHFERSVLTEEEAAKYRWIREQLLAFQNAKGLSVTMLPQINPSESFTKLVVRVGKRPKYPRFNRKIPKE